MPTQFIPVDGLAGATPLAALRGGEVAELWKLLFGIHAGAIGETCAAAILLAALYLILRRRVRLIAPACLLVTVALLSWLLWSGVNFALYAVLAGGVLFAALLFADKETAPASSRDQIVVGVVAGTITVLIRRFGGWAEGAAVGVLAAQILVPLLPIVYTFCRFAWTHVVRACRLAWDWAKPYLTRVFRFVGKHIVKGARWIWTAIYRGARWLFGCIKNLLKKKKK